MVILPAEDGGVAGVPFLLPLAGGVAPAVGDVGAQDDRRGVVPGESNVLAFQGKALGGQRKAVITPLPVPLLRL